MFAFSETGIQIRDARYLSGKAVLRDFKQPPQLER